MGWEVIKQRLVWNAEGRLIKPTAVEIFKLLNSGKEHISGIGYEPLDSLGIRFARVGGKIVLHINFNEATKEIVLKVLAQKGQECCELEYENGILPDSVVINNVWYNLLTNYDETEELLRKSEVYNSGVIALGQYIRMVKKFHLYSAVEVEDNAKDILSNHPLKGTAERMPTALNAVLYPYQQVGFQWMKFIADEKIGCILGDEMGLGKTLQIIALITDRRTAAESPALVIAPVSLLENWRREFEKFTKGLRICIHHGARRTGLYTDLLEFDAVIIAYNTAFSDQAILKMINWDMVVVDEAQNIKNPTAQRTQAIKKIPHGLAVAVTGTPFENHMSDLWSVMDFVAPGCLGKLSEFEALYPDDIIGAGLLEPILTPLMIRRQVSAVAKDLPERVDIPQIIQMSSEEIDLYEEEREKIISQSGQGNVSISILQKLRMFCTHPSLLSEECVDNPLINSSKYQRFCELMEEIISLGEKAVLFTSYNKMFEILKKDVPTRFEIPILAINGSTPVDKRQLIIDDFSKINGSALLVLNPRAVGVGLNIVAASRVIHYNPEWNPALEDQASARVYRRGQTKTVFIYRLYYKGTVEEIMNERIEKKREMFGAAVIGVDGSCENTEDILKALMISPEEGKNGEQTRCNN
ncbi:MAG TPA: ATP-dependent helicase [Lachnospiraceae bacterium]|nr:ATP-dependent helicase [Lachnospiraceae bacterium]